jgi:hypothetical protein
MVGGMFKMNTEMRRQGDLLFIKTNKHAGTLTKKDGIILKSDVTGHAHRLEKGDVYVNVPDREFHGNFYLFLHEDSRILHEEHDPLHLAAGIWEVRRQREVNGYVYD